MVLKRLIPAIAIALASFFGASAQATTVSIEGTRTLVKVVAPLGDLGLSATPAGTAKVNVSGKFPVFSFPITSWTQNPKTGQNIIAHEGSGVTLTGGGVSVTVGNFLIKTLQGKVMGDVAGGPQDVRFFNFGTVSEKLGVELLISKQLAGALTGAFGAPNLTGATFGYAKPQVAPIPLPGGLALMAAGLGALGLAGMRRRRGAATA